MSGRKVYLIGLGNPGFQYKNTRHNAGYMVADEFTRRRGRLIGQNRSRSKLTREVNFDGITVVAIKPLLYMNRSGDAVLSVRNELLARDSALLVVYDDVSLPFGAVRLRPGGGAGGHKGVKSLIAALGTENFSRLRVGIKADAEMPLEDFVLQPFSRAERAELGEILSRACDAVEVFIREGIETAMNRFNQKAPRGEE